MHRTLFATIAAASIFIGATATLAAEGFYEGVDPGFPAPTGDPSVLPPDSKLMRVFDGGCVLTEGIAPGPDGFMYFTDITISGPCKDKTGTYVQAGNIWRYDPKSGDAIIFRSPSGMANGLKFDTEGRMIAALGADYGGQMVVRTDMESGRSHVLTATYDGGKYAAPNDVSIDEKGRIYFSDVRYVGFEPVEQPGFGVYRIDRDGSVARILSDAAKPNGVLVSPDQKSLYVGVLDWNNWMHYLNQAADPLPGKNMLLGYDLAEDGTASNRRVLVDYGDQVGPDGMIADEKGNIYVAERTADRSGIAIRDADGKELGFIPVSGELPTNVGWGSGEELDVLYVTSGKSLYKIQMVNKGYVLK